MHARIYARQFKINMYRDFFLFLFLSNNKIRIKKKKRLKDLEIKKDNNNKKENFIVRQLTLLQAYTQPHIMSERRKFMTSQD
jgi:hypothetical protein